jgi:hypothetical protein
MPTKRTTQTAATRPMTGAKAFEAGRRAYEAAAAGSTGAAAPTADPRRAPVTTRAATLRYGALKRMNSCSKSSSLSLWPCECSGAVEAIPPSKSSPSDNR